MNFESTEHFLSRGGEVNQIPFGCSNLDEEGRPRKVQKLKNKSGIRGSKKTKDTYTKRVS